MLSESITEEHNPTRNERRVAQIITGCVAIASLTAVGVGVYYKQHDWNRKMAALQAKHAAAEARIESLTAEYEAIAALLDSRDTIVAVLDSQGRVQKWNPAAERYSGISEKDMIGKTLEWVMLREDWERHEKGFREFMSDPQNVGKMTPVDCRINNPERGTRLFAFNVRAIGQKGQLPEYAIAVGDLKSRIET